MSRPEDNLHAKLPADPSDVITDPFCVGEHYQCGSASPLLWQCLGGLHIPVSCRRQRGGVDEGTGVSVLPFTEECYLTKVLKQNGYPSAP